MDKATNSAGNGPKIDFPQICGRKKEKKNFITKCPTLLPKFGWKLVENRSKISPKKPTGLSDFVDRASGGLRTPKNASGGWAFGLSLRPDPSLIPNTFVEKVIQYIYYIYPFLYSTLYKFLCGLEGRYWLAMQGVPGSKLATARKTFFLFFTFFLDLAKISKNPKLIFEIRQVCRPITNP